MSKSAHSKICVAKTDLANLFEFQHFHDRKLGQSSFKTIAKVLLQEFTTEPSIVLTKEPNNAVNRRTLCKNNNPDLGIKKLFSSYRYRVKQN